MKKIDLLLVVLCLTTTVAFSQDKKVKTINDFYIDFAVPDIYAFNMLGTTPTTVAKPGTIKELGAEVLNIVSSGASITPGLGIEWSPYLTFTKTNSNQITQYRKSPLRGIQLTFGSLQDSLGSKVAYGIKWTVFDKGDPLLNADYQAQIIGLRSAILAKDPMNGKARQAFGELAVKFYSDIDSMFNLPGLKTFTLLDPYLRLDDKAPAPHVDILKRTLIPKLDSLTQGGFSKNVALVSRLDRIIFQYVSVVFAKARFTSLEKSDFMLLNDSLKAVMEDFKKRNWNKFTLQFGAGEVLCSKNNTWKSLASEKFVIYGSTRLPFIKNEESGWGGQAIFQAQYNHFLASDSLGYKSLANFGTRVLYGNSDFRVSIEGMYSNGTVKDSLTPISLVHITAGVEFKLNDGIWLEIAVGANGDPSEFNKAGFLSMFNLKYALQPKRRFDIGK